MKFVEKIKRHILRSVTFFLKSEIYEITWKNMVQPVSQATEDSMILRMCIACWIPKATDTHSECAILIAFPRQQWLHECASISR